MDRSEWLDFVEQFWSEDGSIKFEGQYFHGLDVEAYPKPFQAPRPVLLNAGNSASGIDFSARNVDINFASLATLDDIKAYTSTSKEKARREHGRKSRW